MRGILKFKNLVLLSHIRLTQMFLMVSGSKRSNCSKQGNSSWRYSGLWSLKGIFLVISFYIPLSLTLLLSQDNPNCMLIVTPQGGHLGWVAGAEAPFGCPWTDPTVMDFLDHLERGKSNGLPCTGDLENVKLASIGS